MASFGLLGMDVFCSIIIIYHKEIQHANNKTAIPQHRAECSLFDDSLRTRAGSLAEKTGTRSVSGGSYSRNIGNDLDNSLGTNFFRDIERSDAGSLVTDAWQGLRRNFSLIWDIIGLSPGYFVMLGAEYFAFIGYVSLGKFIIFFFPFLSYMSICSDPSGSVQCFGN
jgi:hypothetical protein